MTADPISTIQPTAERTAPTRVDSPARQRSTAGSARTSLVGS